jgi:hypothetical protein
MAKQAKQNNKKEEKYKNNFTGNTLFKKKNKKPTTFSAKLKLNNCQK